MCVWALAASMFFSLKESSCSCQVQGLRNCHENSSCIEPKDNDVAYVMVILHNAQVVVGNEPEVLRGCPWIRSLQVGWAWSHLPQNIPAWAGWAPAGLGETGGITGDWKTGKCCSSHPIKKPVSKSEQTPTTGKKKFLIGQSDFKS